MYIYRFCDKDSNIIYIGSTKNLDARITTHKHLSQECYDSVSRIEYIELDEANAVVWELILINIYMPKWNTQSKATDSSSVSFKDEFEWKLYQEFCDNNIFNVTYKNLFQKLANDYCDSNYIVKRDSKHLDAKSISKLLGITEQNTRRLLKLIVSKGLMVEAKIDSKTMYFINPFAIDLPHDVNLIILEMFNDHKGVRV